MPAFQMKPRLGENQPSEISPSFYIPSSQTNTINMPTALQAKMGNAVGFSPAQTSIKQAATVQEHKPIAPTTGEVVQNKVIQKDYARELPNPDAAVGELTETQIAQAISYNRERFHNAPEVRMIRDVLGLSHDAPTIDADLVRAVATWQAQNNITHDGKLGYTTLGPLVREVRSEGLRDDSLHLAVHRKASQWANNFENKFDAELDHQNARLELHVKIKFNFLDAGNQPDFDGTSVPTTGWTEAQKASFITNYRTQVGGRWSRKHAFEPETINRITLNSVLSYYNVLVRIEAVETGQHHTVNVANIAEGTFFRSSAAVGSATLDSNDARNRDLAGGTQRGTEHEFGHMMGIGHPAAGNDAAAYAADAASIMGSGHEVRVSNYEPFLRAINQIAGITFKTVPVSTL
jgi:hypothetical protein